MVGFSDRRGLQYKSGGEKWGMKSLYFNKRSSISTQIAYLLGLLII